MYRIASSMLVLTLAAVTCTALPTAWCLEDDHCSVGYYCEGAVRLCRKCIACEELGRARPAVDGCVKSVAECGECLEGLVLSPARAHCGPAQTPRWWWAVLASALLVAALIGALIVLVLRNFDTYKILACTTTQSHAASSTGVPASVLPPPAPLAPPPPYSTVVALPAPALHSEESLPFIKPLPARGSGDAGGGARRAEGESQAARVCSPPRYEDPLSDAPNPPDSLSTIQEVSSDNSIGNSHSTLASREGQGEGTPLHMPIVERAAKPVAVCQWSREKDNNNTPDPAPEDNKGRGGGGGGGGSGAAASTAIIINLMNNSRNAAQVNQLNT